MADEQQAEPLTGAELNEILGRLDQSRQFLASGINDDVASGFKLASAMSDIARLLATLEAVRPVVVALADEPLGYSHEAGNYCVLCPADQSYSADSGWTVTHTPDCPVTQARALKERLGW